MSEMEVRVLVKRAGGPVAVASALGLTHGAVSQWRRVPAQHVLTVSDLSGALPHEIRPDVFPKPTPEPAHG